MKKKVGILIMFLTLLSTLAVSKSILREEPAFCEGEKARYTIYYNLGFIWIHAGDVDFSVSKKEYQGEECYHLQLNGYTTKSFDRLYRIRDTFTTIMRVKDLQPLYHREVKNEDSYFSEREYYFDAKGGIKWKRNRRGVLTSGEAQVGTDVMDLISICYKFRGIDTKSLEKGETTPFKLFFDEEKFELGLTYKGEEEIKLRNKSKYKSLKFVPKLITGDLFKNEDDMAVFVSDDGNHVPLYIEAKIKVGAVKVMLDFVENTKDPMSSVITKKK